MAELQRYRTLVADSARWKGFRFRPGDIVISTPPKSGTTWMQMLCALLVFDTTHFDRPMAQISPWLDMQTASVASVTERLEAQQHRRFIKTHTPLDGLPYEPDVTYVGVGRDPRDVYVAWAHHMTNLDFEALLSARSSAVGLDDLDEMPNLGPSGPDRLSRFRQWVDDEGPLTTGGHLAFVLHHLRTFWDRRHSPNIVLFHYSDLLADLPGQLRRLADSLEVKVSDHQVEELARAATFAAMKARADDLAPDVDNRIWRSNQEFFHRGSSGQWRTEFDEASLVRYQERVAELVPADLATWAHAGWLGVPQDERPWSSGLA